MISSISNVVITAKDLITTKRSVLNLVVFVVYVLVQNTRQINVKVIIILHLRTLVV